MSQAFSISWKSSSLWWSFFAVGFVLLHAVLPPVLHKREFIQTCDRFLLLVVLVLATSISVYNAFRSNRSVHVFWVFAAMGSGLWALNSLLTVMYVLAPRELFYDPGLCGTVLFLHTVMLLAAVASRPHVEKLQGDVHRAAVDGLLLLSFGTLVYLLLLVSGEFSHWNSLSRGGFAIVYCVLNAMLAVIAVVVARSTKGVWRSIYLWLFGASTIYAIGSLVANLRVGNKTYRFGFFDELNVVAACLLLQAAICGKRAAIKPARMVVEDGPRHLGTSAIVISTTVLLVGMSKLVPGHEPERVYPAHLATVLVVSLLLTATVFTREYLLHRRFARDIDRAYEQLHLAMLSGKSIAWDVDVSTGKGIWSGDLRTFLGIPAATSILPMQQFCRSIHPDDRLTVSQRISDALRNDKPFAVAFRVILPNNASIWVSSHGRFHYKGSGSPSRLLGVAVDIEDKKHLQAVLDEKDSKLRLVLESAAEGIFGIDLNGYCTFCSAAVLRLLGFNHSEDLIGRRIEDLIHSMHADGRPYAPGTSPVLAALRGNETHSGEEFWRANGRSLPVEYWAYPLRRGSEIIGAMITFTDLTQRRKIESALRETESRFRNVADGAPVLLWMSGKEALCDYFNKTWLDFTGKALEAEFGSGWTAGIYPQDKESYIKTYNEAYAERKSFSVEYRLRRHDGEYRWILANGVPRLSLSGEFEGYVGSATDVTEVRRAEEILEKSEEEFNLAFDAAHLGWWVWNEQTEHVIASDGTRVVLGLPLGSEPTLESFLNAVHPEDRDMVHRVWQRAIEEGAYYFVEHRTIWPDGTIHWVESRGRTRIRSDNKPVQMVGVTMDITERKRAEYAVRGISGRLIVAQEEERARIARELHDDVCQRLATLAIELERMKDHPELPSATVESAARLAQFTGEIANDLQALSHELHSSKLEILGLRAAIRSFCVEFAKQHHIEVEFTSGNVPFPLSPDVSVCLYRILQEALRNAAKHSRADRIFAKLHGGHHAVELTVKDYGVGFDPDHVARGHGLGLISMRERANLVKGTLSIESRPNRGTTIRARIPVEEMNAAQSA